jgi:hypothetical protein
MRPIKTKLTLAVIGERRGTKFKANIKFTLVPPETRDYYGNGYYMNVEHDNCIHYIDVRYSGTTDIDKLARIWVRNYFGNNAKEIKEIA